MWLIVATNSQYFLASDHKTKIRFPVHVRAGKYIRPNAISAFLSRVYFTTTITIIIVVVIVARTLNASQIVRWLGYFQMLTFIVLGDKLMDRPNFCSLKTISSTASLTRWLSGSTNRINDMLAIDLWNSSKLNVCASCKQGNGRI